MNLKSGGGLSSSQVNDQIMACMCAMVQPPVARSLLFDMAYQASDPTKPTAISIVVGLVTNITIGSASNTAELVIGATSAVSSGTGVLADTFRNDLSVTLITIGLTQRQKLMAFIPAGYFFAVRRTVGTGISIISAYDQALC